MNDPASSRTLHLGQFRLVRLQVANWGTFNGYRDLPVDERGVLFTGPSGSGKSSLLDGHSVVMLPTHLQRFNASAGLTARGARQGTRSDADYVRGAWAHGGDEHGQGQVRYLRGGRPTWSAIGATYDDGEGHVTTGVVVKWFTGTETDGAHLKTMHQLHDGHFTLTALNEWAGREFDLRWLKGAYPPPRATYPGSEAEYGRLLARRVGLGTSKTALALLGKAKAGRLCGLCGNSPSRMPSGSSQGVITGRRGSAERNWCVITNPIVLGERSKFSTARRRRAKGSANTGARDAGGCSDEPWPRAPSRPSRIGRHDDCHNDMRHDMMAVKRHDGCHGTGPEGPVAAWAGAAPIMNIM